MRSDRCGSGLIDSGDAPSWYRAMADQADVGRVMSDRVRALILSNGLLYYMMK